MLISSHSVQLTAYTLQPHTHSDSYTPTHLHAYTAVSCSLSKRASQQFINVLINIHAVREGGRGKGEGEGAGTAGTAALKTNTRGSRT